MTEKRFEITNSNSYYVGFDITDYNNGNRYYGGRLAQAGELCELLNELHEENQSLKQQLKNLRRLANEIYMEGSE